MKPTWDTDCTYDAEAAAEFGSTITIEDSGIDKNKKYTVRITAQLFLTKYLPADAALQG